LSLTIWFAGGRLQLAHVHRAFDGASHLTEQLATVFRPHLISGQLHVVVLTATRVGAWRDTRPDAASSTSTVEQEPGARLFPQPRPATPMSSDLASHVVRLRIVRILVLPADDSEAPCSAVVPRARKGTAQSRSPRRHSFAWCGSHATRRHQWWDGARTSSGLECEDWLLLQKSVGGGCGGPWCMSPYSWTRRERSRDILAQRRTAGSHDPRQPSVCGQQQDGSSRPGRLTAAHLWISIGRRESGQRILRARAACSFARAPARPAPSRRATPDTPGGTERSPRHPLPGGRAAGLAGRAAPVAPLPAQRVTRRACALRVVAPRRRSEPPR
jgi:hypothetical protein